MSLYEDLGLEPGADAEAIKAAWRRIAKECHPDTGQADPAAGERFRKASAAYEVLSDSERRRRYDATGDTDPNDEDARLKIKATQAVGEALATALPRCIGDPVREMNVVTAAMHILRGKISEFQRQRNECVFQIENLSDLAMRVKGPMLERMVADLLDEAKNGVPLMNQNIRIAERAIEILASDYAHDVEAAQPGNITAHWAPFGTTYMGNYS